MILFLNEQRRIRAYNALISAEDAGKYKGAVGFYGEYPPTTEKREGFYPIYYLEEDGKTIRTEWKEFVLPQPTQLDRIEALAVAGNDIEEKTLGEVTNLGESNLIIMEALATQYEEGLENDLNNKEVLATIYEELLAQKEVK